MRAEGGVLWGELNDATAAHGLAVTGGAISTTGVAGLTLGGGLGWLMARYGLTADNLVSVELVTADGAITEVTEASRCRPSLGTARWWRELRDRDGADLPAAPRSGRSRAG